MWHQPTSPDRSFLQECMTLWTFYSFWQAVIVAKQTHSNNRKISDWTLWLLKHFYQHKWQLIQSIPSNVDRPFWSSTQKVHDLTTPSQSVSPRITSWKFPLAQLPPQTISIHDNYISYNIPHPTTFKCPSGNFPMQSRGWK